jgi:hypothetical protein
MRVSAVLLVFPLMICRSRSGNVLDLKRFCITLHCLVEAANINGCCRGERNAGGKKGRNGIVSIKREWLLW